MRDNKNLMEQLTIDEGNKNKMYLDSRGIPTIGIGHNLRDKSISTAAVAQIFNDDIQDCINDLNDHLPWWITLDLARQDVLLNMCFNLGIGSVSTGKGLLGFQKTLLLIHQGQYLAAADAMLQSKWAMQVGDRAKRLADVMRGNG